MTRLPRLVRAARAVARLTLNLRSSFGAGNYSAVKTRIKKSAVGVALAVFLCGHVVVGCSGPAVVSGGCNEAEGEEYIDLENSRIDCSEAQGMLYVLADIRRPQRAGRPGNYWTCVRQTSRPLPIRCNHGQRHFSMKAADSG